MTLQDIADRLIGNPIPEIGQRAHNPVIAPGAVLLGHADNQRFDFSVDARSARASTLLRAIELPCNEPPVPRQDGIGLGRGRYLSECFAA